MIGFLNSVLNMVRRRGIRSLACLLVVAAGRAPTAVAITIDTVLVGNPGNAPDVAYSSAGPFGSVAYQYRMGTYEVTNDQYAAFLNSVAAEDPNGLYNLGMGEIDRGGILRSGFYGGYVYTVKENMGSKPVNWVSLWDAARFVNWLHNGQGGGQSDETTEDGVYALGGLLPTDLPTWTRKAGAKWFLPTENEWYKAAFYDPRPASAGGPPGDDHYWLYATKSDATPLIASANAQGDVSNPGANVVNYFSGADWNGLNGNFTTAGSAGTESASYFGTFDQAGNISEFTETFLPPIDYVRSGGSWDSNNRSLIAASNRSGSRASMDQPNSGFRVAAMAAVSTNTADFDGDGDVDGADFLSWQRGLGTGTMRSQGDANGSGTVDADDLAIWKTQFGGAGGVGSASLAAPEPAAATLVAGSWLAMCLVRRRRFTRCSSD